MKEKPIPPPTDELKAKCNADNQFGNFDRAFRRALAVEVSSEPKQPSKRGRKEKEGTPVSS